MRQVIWQSLLVILNYRTDPSPSHAEVNLPSLASILLLQQTVIVFSYYITFMHISVYPARL